MAEVEQPGQRWAIIVTRQAEKTLSRLPRAAFRAVDRAIVGLGVDPHSPECQQLAGPYDNLYRLRVGEWRIAYAVEDERRVVLILEIAPKRQPERYRLEEEIEEGVGAEDKGAEIARPELIIPEDLLYHLAQEAESLEAQKRNFADFIRLAGRSSSEGSILRLIQEIIASKAGTEAAEAQAKSPAWYVLLAYSGYKDKVKQNLLERIESLAMQDKIFQVVALAEKDEVGEAETRFISPVQYSPGFLLVEMILDEDSWYTVINTPGVTGFIGAGGKPTPLSSEEVNGIFEQIRGQAERSEMGQTDQEKIRLLITGESSETLSSLRQLLDSEPDVEIVATVPHSHEGFKVFKEKEPDVVIRDFILPMSRFQQFPATEAPVNQVFVQDAFDYLTGSSLGGGEFLIQPVSSKVLTSSIRRVYQGKRRMEAEQRQMSLAARWFSQRKLGEFVEISLSVADLAESLAFYERLGLEKIDGSELPYPWATVSDGKLHLGLHQHVFPSPSLCYFDVLHRNLLQTGTSFRIELLQDLGIVTGQAQQLGVKFGFGEKGEALTIDFKTPEGQRVVLADMLMHRTPVAEKFSMPIRGFMSRCNSFGELSLKTENVEAAVSYWEQLGFRRVAGNDSPYPWATVTDGLIRLGLHQKASFGLPTISYFRADMPERLEQLEQQGVTFVCERKDAGGQRAGALVRSPDGQPIMLFSGEIS